MKGEKDLQTERLFGSLIRGLPVQAEARDGIDMVYDQVKIPLGQILKTCPLWQDLTEFCMRVFHPSFLAAPHRIAVIDACSFGTVTSGFQCIGITEFPAAVGQDRFKDDAEGHGPEAVFNTVKHCPDGPFGTAVQEIGEEQFFISEIEGEDALL